MKPVIFEQSAFQSIQRQHGRQHGKGKILFFSSRLLSSEYRQLSAIARSAYNKGIPISVILTGYVPHIATCSVVDHDTRAIGSDTSESKPNFDRHSRVQASVDT